MIQTLTNNNTYEDMCGILRSDGVFKIHDYILGDDLYSLHDEVLEKCTTEGDHYEFGRNYRGPHLDEFSEDSYIFKTFHSQWMYKLYQIYSGGQQQYGKNVFATHDFKYTGDLARNGWLHFDRNWCLKFFLYLTDIDKSCGAFSCSVGSRQKGEVLRNMAWGVQNYDVVKNRIELDYPELLEIYPDEPVEAKAGTLIVFDTNTFHKGGQVEKGKERLVVRLHCG